MMRAISSSRELRIANNIRAKRRHHDFTSPRDQRFIAKQSLQLRADGVATSKVGLVNKEAVNRFVRREHNWSPYAGH